MDRSKKLKQGLQEANKWWFQSKHKVYIKQQEEKRGI